MERFDGDTIIMDLQMQDDVEYIYIYIHIKYGVYIYIYIYDVIKYDWVYLKIGCVTP